MANKAKAKSKTNINQSSLMLKKHGRSLNQMRFRKLILILMVLAFVVPIVGGLIIWLIYLI
ncbi:MAG: hypothetical protein GX676_05175 [Bacilli bacterium]|nr:hypothetical protein [Bacilli bacterium]